MPKSCPDVAGAIGTAICHDRPYTWVPSASFNASGADGWKRPDGRTARCRIYIGPDRNLLGATKFNRHYTVRRDGGEATVCAEQSGRC